jgi:hypothetical protein
MSIFSTVDITAKDAKEYILKAIDTLSNDELEMVMWQIYGDSTLSNFWIVDSYKEDIPRQFCNLQSEFDSVLEERKNYP